MLGDGAVGVEVALMTSAQLASFLGCMVVESVAVIARLFRLPLIHRHSLGQLGAEVGGLGREFEGSDGTLIGFPYGLNKLNRRRRFTHGNEIL